MKTSVAAAVFLTALAGCNYTEKGETQHCIVTLSGEVNGTWDCRPATVAWMPSFNNVAFFTFTIPQQDDQPGIDVSIGWARKPVAGHYSSSDPDADGNVMVTMPPPASGRPTIYSMRVGPSVGGSTGGSYDLQFDRCEGPLPRYTGYAFNASGTLDASIGSGDVMVHVAF
jgi:hypothetical protein